MTRTSFDLRREPWVPVRRIDGSTEEVSLRDALARAHEFTTLGGELPTTSVALLRLLLAVLHRALPGSDTPVAAWEKLWQQNRLPMGDIDDYLDTFGDRFDLLHQQQPFLQVADLHTAKGTVGDLLPLIADVPNGDQFFTTRARRGTTSLDWSEAARWLVHCQAYDPSGIKSGAVGDPRVKAGKGYPIGVAWAGTIGAVIVEGRTLHETLLLNLCLQAWNGDPHYPGDQAVWERPPLTATEESFAGRLPNGPADMFTWPSRRIRLVHNGEQVVGVLICNGDSLVGHNQFVEPMTAWRRSESQEKKLNSPHPVYLPLTHSPDRSLWRGLAALLPLDAPRPQDGAPRLQPLVLQWLQSVRNLAPEALSDDTLLRTRAVGVVYGSNNSVVSEVVDDALTVHAVLFGQQGQVLRAVALEAVSAAEATATAVGQLAANLSTSAGGEGAAARSAAREIYYFALDTAFRRWLADLRVDSIPSRAGRDWQVTASDAALEQEKLLLTAAGPAAWTGREVRGRTGSRHVDAALASLWFRLDLRKALPLAHSEDASAVRSEEEVA